MCLILSEDEDVGAMRLPALSVVSVTHSLGGSTLFQAVLFVYIQRKTHLDYRDLKACSPEPPKMRIF